MGKIEMKKSVMEIDCREGRERERIRAAEKIFKRVRVRSEIDVYLSCTNSIASCSSMIRSQCIAVHCILFIASAFWQKNSYVLNK